MNIYPVLKVVIPTLCLAATILFSQALPEKRESKQVVKADTADEEAVTVETPDGKLFGTMIMPTSGWISHNTY